MSWSEDAAEASCAVEGHVCFDEEVDSAGQPEVLEMRHGFSKGQSLILWGEVGSIRISHHPPGCRRASMDRFCHPAQAALMMQDDLLTAQTPALDDDSMCWVRQPDVEVDQSA